MDAPKCESGGVEIIVCRSVMVTAELSGTGDVGVASCSLALSLPARLVSRKSRVSSEFHCLPFSHSHYQ